MAKVEKNDFVDLEFTGFVNETIFDSNIPEDLKKLSPEAKPEKTIVIIGQGMLVPGFDKSLEGKETDKEYEIHIPYKDGFGPRKRELVKTIPLHVFTKHKVKPYPGATLYLDNMLVRVITISGARVVTDFNNPLAGKDLDYKFKIKRIVTDEKEKLDSYFKFFFKFLPEYDISEKAITIKAKPEVEPIISVFKDKFKEIFNKDLEFKSETAPKEKEQEQEIRQ